MDGVVTTRLGPGDEREVERFADAFDDPVDAKATREFLRDGRHHLIVAYVDAAPAGFVSATEVLHPDKVGPELFLNEIGVVDAFRRRGAGAALIEELKRLGSERGCRLIWVLTDEGNPAAMGLYAKAGGAWDGGRHVMFELDLAETSPGVDPPDEGRG
ncbi:MAG: GNAT family N-acetyltransferase [Actinomycetota bacterium]